MSTREIQAAAWQEGFDAGEWMARCWGHTDWWEDYPSNPYEEIA